LGLKFGPLNLDDWQEMMQRARHPDHEVTIAVVGKYIDHNDAYKSIYESLDHAGFAKSARVCIRRIEAEEMEKQEADRLLSGVDGLLIPGGFGMRGTEGKIQAIRYARENKIPFFGICLGMQCAVIEFARNAMGLDGANSTEFDRDTAHPVICLLEEQESVSEKGATMRLGAQPCELDENSISAACYETSSISERHRHRYEFNGSNRRQFAEHGMIAAGASPDGELVEIVEIPDHPWFVAVQFHPEFKSKPNKEHPLFRGFIEAAIRYHRDQVPQTV
jgi:CTP synthase